MGVYLSNLDLVHVEPILVDLNTVNEITLDLSIVGLNDESVLYLIFCRTKDAPRSKDQYQGVTNSYQL